MSACDANQAIVFDDVSKFYGEVLGVNRVNLTIARGITSLVGPNGSGKTTLMNLMTGLVRPTRGRVSVLGTSPDRPEALFRQVGYCAQFDSFPPGLTGFDFVSLLLGVHGFSRAEARRRAFAAIERVGLVDAMYRKVGGYSKGMRQRIRLAQAVAHDPRVLVLDEPLNGLDPMARAEVIRLFKQFAADGLFIIISSHILHEVDMMSDRVVLINNGYLVAQGEVHGVRVDIEEQPMQVLVRCDRPSALASRLFEADHVVEARIHDDRKGLFVRTRDAERLYLLLNEVIVETGLEVESVAPVDDDLNAVYQYLIAKEGRA
jgi:ABC-2 type transport system ATP-binding protein